MTTIQKHKIEQKNLTYFDVVRTLNEGLAKSGLLLASDPY